MARALPGGGSQVGTAACRCSRERSAMTATTNDCTLSVFDAQALAAMVGVQPHELPPACGATLAANSLDFELLVAHEREEQLLRALRGGEADDLRVSGPHRV